MYFSIITQALTYAAMLLFFRNDTGFGGNNGFTDFKRILGYPDRHAGDARGALRDHRRGAARRRCCSRAASSPRKFGRVLTAIRDAESRVMFCGYNPVHYKLFVWTLSAVLCGIAGALYVPQVGIINPSEMSPANSIEIAIWVAVGGRGTLIGPIARRVRRQRREELVHAGVPRVLAVLPRPALHPRDAVPAAGRGRPRCAGARRRDVSAAIARCTRADARRPAALAQAGMRVAGAERRHHARRRSSTSTTSPSASTASRRSTSCRCTIDDGELRCIIGPNGAGKTTMMDVITGKTRPDAGTAFFGQTIDLTRLTEAEIAHAGIGRKFQKPTVFEQHTVFENLELAMKADKRVRATLVRAARARRARPHRRDAAS